MTTRDRILEGAERTFDAFGFNGASADRLVRGAAVSSRTLYKHAGSKEALAGMVLDARGARFLACLQAEEAGDGVAGLFARLAHWIRTESARGCLFLRAHSELAESVPEIRDKIALHKSELEAEIGRRVAQDLGRPDTGLTLQILLLFEGATAAAVYRGAEAAEAAGHAAAALLRAASEGGSGAAG
jgi:AcrR family transcriptional regulator